MIRIPLTEAQLHLPELIASLQPGEEVQFFFGNRTVARLIGELQPPHKPRQPGSAIGTLTILSEDETHLEDFHDYSGARLSLIHKVRAWQCPCVST